LPIKITLLMPRAMEISKMSYSQIRKLMDRLYRLAGRTSSFKSLRQRLSTDTDFLFDKRGHATATI
jgi:hypothetical protein